MTYTECLAALPQNLRDKWDAAMVSCHNQDLEYIKSSLANDNFPNIGEFINLSMTWSNTPQGHEYWHNMARFFGKDIDE